MTPRGRCPHGNLANGWGDFTSDQCLECVLAREDEALDRIAGLERDIENAQRIVAGALGDKEKLRARVAELEAHLESVLFDIRAGVSPDFMKHAHLDRITAALERKP